MRGKRFVSVDVLRHKLIFLIVVHNVGLAKRVVLKVQGEVVLPHRLLDLLPVLVTDLSAVPTSQNPQLVWYFEQLPENHRGHLIALVDDDVGQVEERVLLQQRREEGVRMGHVLKEKSLQRRRGQQLANYARPNGWGLSPAPGRIFSDAVNY